MLGMKLVSGGVALIAGLAVTATAEAAPRLSGVGSAAYAHPGGELVVRAAARRAARALHALRRPPPLVRRRRARGTGRARASRRVVVRVAARVPAAAPLGAYRVLACARSRCAASKAKVTLTSDPMSTAELIEREVSAGRLSRERGLVYRVFAAFGDHRLPARLAGDDGGLEGDSVPREVAAAWPTLSRRARRTLAPFLMRPPSRRSWAAGRRRNARRAVAARGRPTIRATRLLRVRGPLHEHLRRRRQVPDRRAPSASRTPSSRRRSRRTSGRVRALQDDHGPRPAPRRRHRHRVLPRHRRGVRHLPRRARRESTGTDAPVGAEPASAT